MSAFLLKKDDFVVGEGVLYADGSRSVKWKTSITPSYYKSNTTFQYALSQRPGTAVEDVAEPQVPEIWDGGGP